MTMVNHLLETSYPPSSSALRLHVSVADPSSIFRTHFQVPYAATSLFATRAAQSIARPFYFAKFRDAESERSQKVQDRLLVSWRERIEPLDHAVGFGRSIARRAFVGIVAVSSRRVMRVDGLQQVIGAPVMQEEDALPDAP